jgi:UV DNA damage endonuclease
MSIGYACLTVGVPSTNFKSCMLKNAGESKLSEIIAHNLNSLENIIEYNVKNDIKLFRISSDLIPFGSSPANNIPWRDIYSSRFSDIKDRILKSGMRVSMHPGQYTVLNSPDDKVVKNAIRDLDYHASVLDCLGAGAEHKIVLHIGGIYGDKREASERFIKNYHKLDESVKRRLVIENDDRSFNISDVLKIGRNLSIPVVFDNLHNKINPSPEVKSEFCWIEECRKTWKEKDGHQKIHYSQENPLKNRGAHSETIRIKEFISFYEKLKNENTDIMLEVKDKNISAVKCINCTTADKKIKSLELEWSRYKYLVLERSQADYLKIRQMLKNKDEYPALSFYELLDESLQKKSTSENSINAAMHVWGYFKEIATDKEKNSFFKDIEDLSYGKVSVRRVKNNLWRMAVKYQQPYLLNSYYFI